MIRALFLACVLLAFLTFYSQTVSSNLVDGFRPPAVPLVVHDPYFSIWSGADNLYDDWPMFWDGTIKAMAGAIRVDGKALRFCGNGGGLPDDTVQQTNLVVTPTNTIYTFSANGAQLKVTFTTPVIPKNPVLLSRTATYLTFEVTSLDGNEHDVSLYFDMSAEITVNTVDQEVTWDRPDNGKEDLVVLRMGSSDQNILQRSGDGIGIDWGYLYLATPLSGNPSTSQLPAESGREAFANNQPLPPDDTTLANPRQCQDNWPASVITWDLGSSSDTQVRHMLIAYDDIFSIEWFGTQLPAYWKAEYNSTLDMLNTAHSEREDLMSLTAAYDKELIANLTNAGGEKYATLASLAFRQAFGGTKAVRDPKTNERIYFLKEISSDGNMNTVDVVFPAFPIFAYADPSILSDMLLPIMAYANEDVPSNYKSGWAPHHIGEYPIGAEIGQEDMPIEETGNMILMLASVYEGGGDMSRFFPKYSPLLRNWANYLVDNLPYPGLQLCTDDFEGASPNNSNLAVKGIVALSAYATLTLELDGDQNASSYFTQVSADYANTWMDIAYTTSSGSPHYMLQYDADGSWSLKYNLLHQRVLGLKEYQFPFSQYRVLGLESQFYLSQMQQYGLPLDNRHQYAKLDWSFWAAAAMGDPVLIYAVVNTAYDFANESPSRVPLSDFYDTVSSSQQGFQNRPVVGGLYSLMIV